MTKQFFLPESLCEVDSSMDSEKLLSSFANHTTINGKILRLDYSNEFFVVDLGGHIMANMPFSESTIYPIYKDDGSFSGNITFLREKVIQAKIKSIDGNNIILSRKDNMLEALENFKNETESILGIVTSFSKLSAFLDIGAGIIGKCYSKHFCNTIFFNAMDVGIHTGDMLSVKIVNFQEDLKSFDLTRVDNSLNPEDFLKEKDVITCKVFTPVGDGKGYFVLIDTIFCGIVDSPKVILNYGDTIEAFIKTVTEKGPKLYFIRKVEKN